MIYKNMPKRFSPKFEVVSCFVEHNGRILLLHRQDHKPQGNTWGIPAGKVDAKETIGEAIIREIRQETGIMIPASGLSYHGKVFVKYSDYDFVYHTFQTTLENEKRVRLNHQEHKDFVWVKLEEAPNLPLIQDLDLCLKLFCKG